MDDGRPHTLRAVRNGQQGSLEIDEFTISEGRSVGTAQRLNVAGDIYIGEALISYYGDHTTLTQRDAIASI